MTNKLFAADSNVLVYLHNNSSPSKRSIAKNILSDNPMIPAQVISEYLNITKRLLDLSKERLLIQTAELLKDCEIIPILPSTLFLAAPLVKKYQFQLFDAIIIAAALEVGCQTLYSEDMHHGLLVNDTLTIITPFI
jgi:predicted nucleic acid-binding protein